MRLTRSARWLTTAIAVATVLVLPPAVGSAAGAVASATTFQLDPEEGLVTADERQAAGYYYGPEGVLGVVPSATTPGEYTFVGSNSIEQPYGFAGRAGRFTGTLAKPMSTEPLGQEADDNITMANTPADIHFTAPSKIYEVPATGSIPAYWLTVVHSERYYSNPVTGEMNQRYGYYATLGMAKSTDRGGSWNYLGEIIRHKTTYQQCVDAANTSTEIGSGAYAIVKVAGVDYFYSYYMDKKTPQCGITSGGDINLLAVARAKVSDVIAAAGTGKTTPWIKYNNGWGAEPGLGGMSSDLHTETNWQPGWYDVSYNTYLSKYILISTGCDVKFQYTGDLCYRESTDGLTWSTRKTLIDFGVGFNVYPTIVGLGSVPGRETGKSFYIYYLHSIHNATIWVDGQIWRVKVTITS